MYVAQNDIHLTTQIEFSAPSFLIGIGTGAGGQI